MAVLYEYLLNPLVLGQLGITTPVKQSASDTVNSVTRLCSPTARQPDRLSLEQLIVLAEAIAAQRIQIERIKRRLLSERQFNKRITINAELRDARQKLRDIEKELENGC